MYIRNYQNIDSESDKRNLFRTLTFDIECMWSYFGFYYTFKVAETVQT